MIFKKLAVGSLVISLALALSACKSNTVSDQTGNRSLPTVASSSTSAVASATVTYSDNGFSPSSVTIKAGQSVEFKNSSASAISVNSDPHPTHTLYPELNLDRIDSGQSKLATFTKPGTYTYHNHLDASMRGTIVVQ